MPGARRISVTITQDMAEILERAVACGAYASPQAIIRAALCDWRQQWLNA
jgi:Arc/MetJ-type ribon-helix-helix transcriptional regulator